MIKLTRPAIPPVTQDKKGHVTQDPSFCGICLNFSPLVAEACHGGRENLYLYNIDSRIQIWDFSSSFADIVVGIEDGCGSCRIIQEAIDRVFTGRVDWSEELWLEKELTVTMAEGNVLRIYLPGFFDQDEVGKQRGFGPNIGMIHPNASIELYCYESGWSLLS